MGLRNVDEWLGNIHSRIVDEDVEPPEAVNFRAEPVVIGHVAYHHGGLAAALDDALRDTVQVGPRPAQQYHLRARSAQGDRRLRADAAARAGNERDAAIQPESRGDGEWIDAGYGRPPGRAPSPTFFPP